MNKTVVVSDELNNFVNKFFVDMDFSSIDSFDKESTVKMLSKVEEALVNINNQNYSNDSAELWFYRELCLRALVVLTQVDFFAETLIEFRFMERALMLLERVMDTFNKKIVEDPEIVKAIQEGRLEEELKKHFPDEATTYRRTSNFIDLIEDSELDVIPEEYEKIPENF